MAVTTGILIRAQGQVAIRRSNAAGASFDTLMVARSQGSACSAAAAFAMFSGFADNSVITVDGDENACLGNLQVKKIVG
jgi:phosphopantothenate synthetase